MNATGADNIPRTGYGSAALEDRDPEAIARDIDATRGQVNQTLDRLQAKLSPGQMVDEALRLLRGTGGEFAVNLGRSVRQNPMPVMLTGIGVLWMIASRNSATSDRGERAQDGSPVSERIAQAGSAVSEKASEAAASVRERVTDVADTLSEKTSAVSSAVAGATQTVTSQARRAREGFSQLLEEQPLLIGTLGIALGALIGYALPATEAEDRLLGETRDRALESVKEAGSQQYAKVREFAADMTEPKESGSPEPS
jgi:hypothetical protein